jgi:hypothetical protein
MTETIARVEAATEITADQLRTLFAYDERTGLFTRRVQTSNRVKVGQVAGYADPIGYVYFCAAGRRRAAHRMAWLYVYGVMPLGEVDHRDTVRHHNWIANLRDEATVVNQHNQIRAHRQSKSGLLGAAIDNRRGGFNAQINVGGKYHFIGHFDTAEAAHAAYVTSKRQLHKGCTL